MVGRAITVEFLGNSRDLTNAMDKAESKSRRFGGTMGKMGKAMAFGLAGGAVLAVAGLAKLTQGAIEDEAAQKKLADAYKNNAKATDSQIAATEKWISAQGVAYGVTDDELRPALQKLVTATKDVDEAQKLATLAMDISAGTGKSLETVTTALAKAQNGSVAGLAKLNIKTKDSVKDQAALQAANIAVTSAQDDYNAALKEYGPGSKEAQLAASKLEYRQTKLGEANGKVKQTTIDFAEAQKRLAKAYGGDAASAADTTAGKMKRLKVILAETGEAIGAKLIPIVTKMADWFLKKGLPAIQLFGAWLHDNLPPIFNRVRAKVTEVFNKLKGPVMDAFNDIKSIVMDAVTIIRVLWKRFGSTIMEYARNTFNNVARIIKGVFQVIKGIFKVFSSLLKGDWKGVWDGIKSIARGAGNILRGIIGQMLNNLKTLFKIAFKALTGIVSAAFGGIKNAVRNGFNAVLGLIKSIPGKIGALGGRFLQAGKDLIGQFVNGLKGAAGLVSDIAGNVWNAVKGLLNNAISKINAALEFTIHLPGPDISINPPNIPALAKGGIVSKPTLALIGEDGPEAVVPLGRKNAPRGSIPGMGGGDVHIHIHGITDKRGAAREIEKALRDLAFGEGRKLSIPVTS